MIKGKDGILYEFVRREHLVSDKIPFYASDETLQKDNYDKSNGGRPVPYNGL